MKIHFPFNFFTRSIKSNIRYLIFEHITCVKFQFPVPVFLTNSKIQMSSERLRVEQLIECGVLIIMETDPSCSQENRGNKQGYFHFIMTSPIKQYSCPSSQLNSTSIPCPMLIVQNKLKLTFHILIRLDEQQRNRKVMRA